MPESTDPRWAEQRPRVFQVLGAFLVGNALLAQFVTTDIPEATERL